MPETFHVVPEEQHNALVTAAYKKRGYSGAEAAAGAVAAIIEAGITPTFEVLDDQSARALIGEARQHVLEGQSHWWMLGDAPAGAAMLNRFWREAP